MENQLERLAEPSELAIKASMDERSESGVMTSEAWFLPAHNIAVAGGLDSTGGLDSSYATVSNQLADKNVVGKLEIVDAKIADNSNLLTVDNDSDSHVDVGNQLAWPRETREKARPKDGQGYYEVMESLGKEFLGRELTGDEVKLLIKGAAAMQAHRGKNPKELNSRDELLPKNEEELNIFLNELVKKQPQGKIAERDARALQLNMFLAFEEHIAKVTADQIVMDLRPVKDQAEVTDKVPTAVYLDSSNIQGGQGYRRTLKCEPETQDYWLSTPTAEALMRVQAALIKDGKEPLQLRNMNGAGRRAIDRELISRCAPDQPHAKKHSQHEDGISIDVDNYDNKDVWAALEKQGFVHNVPGDRPHFTYLPKKK